MGKHPYVDMPDKAFWRRAVAGVKPEQVDPVGFFNVKIRPETKVATAGSCFAQNIARYLKQAGFNFYVTEPGHPILDASIREKNHYGVFSARYGNIYTARQLLQLMQRAYGTFAPLEEAWLEADGSVLDPYRPTVQLSGFVSVAEMHADRRQHLTAVRKMFETLDVFVFTLGLTEHWRSRVDGAVFPVCPGVSGGTFDPGKHEFHNQDVSDIVEDMTKFIELLQSVNQRANIVLTVSPVPLIATAQTGEHVLSATTYSKSVLRVAAETLRRRYAHVHYFPAYEIITGAFAGGRYFAQDLRNVTEGGVAHVMRTFLQHVAGSEAVIPVVETGDSYLRRAEKFVEVECDEVALDADQ